MKRDIEKHIREHWFKNHKAMLTQHGDLQVLAWKEPGTCIYSCRYIFDGNRMYISGDIGEAVYNLTWKAEVHSFSKLDIHYFTEKLSAYAEDRWDYDSGKAVDRLKEWRNQLSEYGRTYDNEKMDQLILVTKGCSSCREWAEVVNCGEYNDFISALDNDYWEWFYKIGNEYPLRMYGYLVGLKMASEQLKAKEHVEQLRVNIKEKKENCFA